MDREFSCTSCPVIGIAHTKDESTFEKRLHSQGWRMIDGERVCGFCTGVAYDIMNNPDNIWEIGSKEDGIHGA